MMDVRSLLILSCSPLIDLLDAIFRLTVVFSIQLRSIQLLPFIDMETSFWQCC